jgi:hypothetical protein
VALLGGSEMVATGGPSIRFWDGATGREILAFKTVRGQVRALGYDERVNDLYIADESGSILVLGLGDLQRGLRELGLDLPGSGP